MTSKDIGNVSRSRSMEAICYQEARSGIHLVYHTNHDFVTCQCGKVIEGEHKCETICSCNHEFHHKKMPGSSASVVFVTKCYFRSSNREAVYCAHCEHAEHKKTFAKQWYVDSDANPRCSECDLYSEEEELPKTCGCKAYDVGAQHFYNKKNECFCASCDMILLGGKEELCKNCDINWCEICYSEYPGKPDTACPNCCICKICNKQYPNKEGYPCPHCSK